MNLKDHLEKNLSINLESISQVQIDDKENIHCENLIGQTTIPLGVAGPIKIKDLELKVKDCYIPLATTEGALIASVNRGCKAINLSGGVNVFVEKIGTTRGPVFFTGSLEKSKQLFYWLKNNQKNLAVIAEKTSSHLKFLKMETKMLSSYVFIRLYFDTDKAMGMNMVTIATDEVSKYIEAKTGFNCLSVSGNYCVDKKPAWINFINGRGFSVWAEAIVTKKITKEVLKTTGKKIFEVWLSKCVYGSIVSGSMGFNCHFANIVAAFFAATGQDLAHVVEGSLGITEARVLNSGDIKISVYLPAVMMGLVGGGTRLKTKKEALSIIKAKNTDELVGVLASAVLAGELSLLSSLSEKTLAVVHKKLGR